MVIINHKGITKFGLKQGKNMSRLFSIIVCLFFVSSASAGTKSNALEEKSGALMGAGMNFATAMQLKGPCTGGDPGTRAWACPMMAMSLAQAGSQLMGAAEAGKNSRCCGLQCNE